MVTAQIKRVGGFKHRKGQAAYFHYSNAPERSQPCAQTQEEPAPLGKPCPSRRKWAEPLVATHLLRCLSTFDVTAPRPGSACEAGEGRSEALRVGVLPSLGTQATRPVPRASESPWGRGGGNGGRSKMLRPLGDARCRCPAGFRVELAKAGVSDTRGLLQRACSGARHFPRAPLRAMARRGNPATFLLWRQ